MTYTLYSSKGSGGFAVEAALAKAGAPFKIATVAFDKGEQHSAAYAAINPLQQIPALLLPDGTLMTESAAMVIHLAAAFPDKGLAPAAGTSAHGAFLRWMVFMTVNLYEADLRYFYPERYTADTDTAGIDDIRVAGAAHMAKSFAVIENALSPYVLGAELSIADVYLAMLAHWSPAPLITPKYVAHQKGVMADPVYGPIFHRHFAKDA